MHLDMPPCIWRRRKNHPMAYRPSLWLDASRGVYQDAAVQFTAADKSWLQIADAAQTGLDPGTDDFLICGWFYFDSLAQIATLFSKGAGGAAPGYPGYMVIVLTDGTVFVRFSDGSAAGIEFTSAAGTITTGAWIHLVFAFDRSGNLTVYKNGSSVGTADISAQNGAANDTNPFYVGSLAGTAGYYLDGRIDSLMFFKKADLSAVASDIIAWAYNSGAGRLCSEITAAQKAAWGAVSGYEMVEPSGRRYDSWGSNHLDQAFADIISPTVNNGGFETLGGGGADVFGTWAEVVQGTSTINDETAAPYAGSHALRVDMDAAGSPTGVRQSPCQVGKLYTISAYAKAAAGTPNIWLGNWADAVALTTSYAAVAKTFRALETNVWILGVTASSSVFIDSVTLRAAEILAAPGIARGVATDSNFAVQLNGTSQYLSYTGTAFDPGVGDFSVGCSFYLDTLSVSGYRTLVSLGTEGNGLPMVWLAVRYDGKLFLEFNHTTGADAPIQLVSAATLCTVGAWYTLVLNVDRDGNASYSINGSALTSIGAVSSRPDACDPGNLVIGRYSGASHYHTGRIDNAFYANRLLTPAEIAYLHNTGQWRQWAEIAADQPSLAAAMVGFWEFDNASALGRDSSGTLGAELITNGGFETAGAGGDDVFDWWAEEKQDGSIVHETTQVHGGSHAAKITAGPTLAASVYRYLAVTPGTTYRLSFWTCGDGTNAGRYYLYDGTNGAEIIPVTSTGVTGATYTFVTKEVIVPAGCVSMGLIFYSPAAAGGVAYFDDVSLKELRHLTPVGTPTQGMGINYLEGMVSRWEDQSGGGKHTTQTTLAKRLAYLSFGINSRPVIFGDGVDDYLDVAAVDLTGAFAICAVFKCDVNPSSDTILGKDANNYVMLTDNTTVTVRIAGGTATAFTVGAIGTGTHVLTVTRDAANNVRVYLDGTESTTGAKSLAGTLAITQLLAHGGDYFSGYVANVLVYAAEKSTGDLARIRRYLANLYGVTL